MKRLIYFMAILFMMISCKKTSYVPAFDKSPQERAADQINLVSTTLTGAPNGWIATLPTQAGGGYSFYMNFDIQENVIMYGDLTDASATTSIKSYYRVKQDIGTDLVFDSYTYISMLDDPNAAILGGAAKIGYSSDIDFIYDRSSADSIVFTGKKYRQSLKLVKATAAQKASYEAAGLKTAIDKFKNFFTTTANPYIEIVSGAATLKAGITINASNNLASGKRMSFTGLLADGVTTASGLSKFAFKIDAMELLGSGLVYQGITFVKVAWKDATTLAMYDSTGKEYIIKSNPTPLLAFKTLFKFNGAFNGIMISGRTLPAGVTSGWNTLWASQIASYDLNSATMESMQFRLTTGNTAKLEVWFVIGGTRYLADASYTYVINDDVITLSNYVPSASNANWNNGWVVTAIKNYFINASFKLDWVVSTNPTVTGLAGLYKVGDPTNFYYGVAIKN
jgi:hypothetical protein